MSKKKHPKKQPSATATKKPPSAESADSPSPYLTVAHPPAKNLALLVVSVILFVVWFLFLLMAAISSSSR